MTRGHRTGIAVLDVPDEAVVARVRAVIERAVSHPSAIAAHVRGGRVTLRGPILTHESHDLLRRAVRVPGVRRLDDQLERHRTGAGVAALQGPGRRAGAAVEPQLPLARLLRGGAGIALGRFGLRRGGGLGIALAAAGGALLVGALRDHRAG